MRAELKQNTAGVFTRISENYFIESILLELLKDLRIRKMFDVIKNSDHNRFSFMLDEDKMIIRNQVSEVATINCNIPFKLINFKFNATKLENDIFIYRTMSYDSLLRNEMEREPEGSTDSVEQVTKTI